MMQVPGAIIQKVVISVTAHVCFGILTNLVVRQQIPSQYVKLVVVILFIIESKYIKGIMFNIEIYLDTYAHLFSFRMELFQPGLLSKSISTTWRSHTNFA